MATPNQERATSVIKDKGGEAPTIQTLNVVPQKINQVNKPSKYYEDKEKTKTFIY